MGVYQRHSVITEDGTGDWMKATEERLHEIEGEIAARRESRQQHPAHNVNQQFQESFSHLDRLALMITTRVGTLGFFFVIITWTVCWLGWNTLAPRAIRFDPRRPSSSGSSSRI